MAEKHEHDEHDHLDSVALPPAAQQLLVQMQTFQQQYQMIAVQRESLAVQKMELDRAVEELSKTGDKEEVFKAVGPILIRSTKAALLKEMNEKKETADARLDSLESQMKKLREKMAEAQTKLQALMAGKQSS
jgi:prefoldin beta subunit